MISLLDLKSSDSRAYVWVATLATPHRDILAVTRAVRVASVTAVASVPGPRHNQGTLLAGVFKE